MYKESFDFISAESGFNNSVEVPFDPDACGYIRLCDVLDLSDGPQIDRGRYSEVAICHLEALRQRRSGILLMRDESNLWRVMTDKRGNSLAYAARVGDDDEKTRVCEVDSAYLKACQTPRRACLLPDNWTRNCEDSESVCPDEADAPDDCVPAVLGPIWITEGDSLAVDIEFICKHGSTMNLSKVYFDELPSGAVFDQRRGRLTWVPGLYQAAVYDLVFRVKSTNDAYTLRIGVADAFDHPDNKPIADPLRYPLEYGLPVFFIEDAEHDEYHPSTLVYAGRRYDEINIKTRGETSLKYPKHSYTLKFDDKELFHEPNRGGGLTNRTKLVLTTTFDDNSYVRQRLSHEMWRILNPRHISVQSYMAIVYRDNEFRGLYTVSDHVDRHLMRLYGLADTGELFKSKRHEGDFLHTKHRMEKKEGLPERRIGMGRFVASANTICNGQRGRGICGRPRRLHRCRGLPGLVDICDVYRECRHDR
ncbi:MAG: CotH kinase family protein [Deltaproteobacteria bacterium]|nr:CotH kinase family protein [Deltaproteobacteria bacterium]